jgi:hypothetical protein
MTKSFINKNHSKNRRMLLVLASVLCITIGLFALLTSTSTISSAQTEIKVAEPSAQVSLNIGYAYVGKETNLTTSYTDSSHNLMRLVSEYPSSVILNISRHPGKQIASCDAEIEVYAIQIKTDKGTAENHAYFIGTNYTSLYESELTSLFSNVHKLVDQKICCSTKGDFKLNWTTNYFLTHSIGTAGCYWTLNSSLGLWSAGKPNDISVTVNRLGYITINEGLISIYKDEPTNTITSMTQLGNHSEGFLYNSLVPADKLSRMNLFDPIDRTQNNITG